MTTSEIKLACENNGGNGSSGEIFFADLFETYVTQSGPRRCLPKFDALFREVPATVGVADFIGVVAPRWRYTQQRLEKRLQGLPRAPVAEILSQLGYSRRVPREALIENSHYTQRVVSMALSGLLKAEVITNAVDRGYAIKPTFKLPQAEIHFYEIKLDKWRRALFQATQAQSYADKVYCVMPVGNKRQVLLDNRELFRRAGVGVILFEPSQWKLVELIPGRKAKPKRPSNKLDVLIRLAGIKNLLS